MPLSSLAPEAVTLAQTIYDWRRFDDMSKLGDVLEAAGCNEPEVLGHCRARNRHVRGCWLIDAMLGK